MHKKKPLQRSGFFCISSKPRARLAVQNKPSGDDEMNKKSFDYI